MARDARVLVIGTLVSQVLWLAATPLLTRIAPPDAFGAFGIWMSLWAPISAMAALRYEMAIVQAETDTAAAMLARLSIVVSCVTGALFLAVTAILAGRVEGWLDSPGLAAALWLLPLASTLFGVMTTLFYWNNRHGAFSAMALGRVANAGVSTITQIGAASVAPTAGALSLGYAFGLAAGSTAQAVGARRSGLFGGEWRLAALRSVAHAFKQFPIRLGPAHLAGAVGLALPTLVLASVGGTTIAGYYTIGVRLVMAPVILVGTSLGDVYRHRAAISYREHCEFWALFLRTASLSGIAAAAYLAVSMVAIPILAEPILGPEWGAAVPYFQLLAVAAAFSLLAAPVDKGALIVGALHYMLVWQVLRLVLTAAVWGLALWLGLSPLATLTGLIVVTAALHTWDVVMQFRFSRGSTG